MQIRTTVAKNAKTLRESAKSEVFCIRGFCMYRRTLSNVAKALEMFAEARMYWMIFIRAKYTIRYQPCIRSFVVVGTINCLTFFLIICRDLLYFLHLVTASIILWENKFYRNNSSISINLYYTFRTSVRKDLRSRIQF